MRRFASSLAAAAALCSCATVAELTRELESKPVCCKSPAEFKYQPLDSAGPASFTLGEGSPVYAFDSGRSYFKAYALPEPLAARKLRVRSSPTGSTAFETKRWSQAYCPQVTFLDAEHRVLASTSRIPDIVPATLLLSFVADFDVPPAARYVVLHSDPRYYGTSSAVRYTAGGTYLVGNSVVTQPGGEAIRHPCAPIADAQVELR